MIFALLLIGATVGVCALWQQQVRRFPTVRAEDEKLFRTRAAAVDPARLRETVETLTGYNTRVPGYTGNQRAADYVFDKFREFGYPRITRQVFPVDVPVTYDARLILPDGTTLRIDPIWPNVVRTCTLPPGGWTGPLMAAGDAGYAHFNNLTLKETAILLPFNCRNDWLNAAQLGARIILFREPEDTLRDEAESKFLSVPADIPRFWIAKDDAARIDALLQSSPQPPVITVHARVRWDRLEAENIIAWIPGSASKEKGATSVVAGYFDSMSVVPDRAPGAEQALSAAALLEMARLSAGQVREGTLMFVASGAHTLGLQGAREFVQTWARDKAKPRLFKSFFGLDLSSHSRRMGFFYKGFYYEEAEDQLQPWLSPIGLNLQDLAARVVRVLYPEVEDPDRILVDGINAKRGRNWRTYLPATVAFDAEAATLAGIPAFTFGTADDARLYVDTPLDTPDRIDYDNLTAQVRLIAALLPDLIDLEHPLVHKDLPKAYGVLSGRTVRFDARKSYLPDEPLPGALVVPQCPMAALSRCGVRMDPPVSSDGEGNFSIRGLPIITAVGPGRGSFKLQSYLLDPETDGIIAARDQGPTRAQDFPANFAMDAEEKPVTSVLFWCAPLTLFDCVDQRYSQPMANLSVYDAGTDSIPFEYGSAIPWSPWKPSSADTVMMAYGKPGMRLRFGLALGALGQNALLLNNSPEDPLGKGFLAGEVRAVTLTAYQAARDLWTLNQDRLARLNSYGITNHRVSELHKRTKNHLDQAEARLKEKRYGEFMTQARSALAYESRAYPEVLGTANDVVRAVVFYLFLLLPFSYFMERLFCGFNTAETRVLGTFGFFLAAFAVLSFTHPAFQITLTPFVVLLAFTVMALAILVIFIVIGRFDRLVYYVKAKTSGIHESSFGRLGAAVAAFDLGVSNLRRRKGRTILTCVTLVFLTFTLLSFVSVEAELSTTSFTFSDKTASYNGLLLRHHAWWPINEQMVLSLDNEYGSRFPVAPRAWYYSALIGNLSFIAVTSGQDDNKAYDVTAVLGLTPQEDAVTQPSKNLLGGRWFKDPKEPGAIIPQEMAKHFGIDPNNLEGAAINVFGARLPVLGILDSTAARDWKDLDDESLMPVDYLTLAQRRSEGELASPDEWQEYFHLLPRAVLIVPYRFLMSLGGNMRSVAMATGDKRDTEAVREALVERTGHTIIAGIDGQSYVNSSVGISRVRTQTGILIPALIAGMIVLNTMLGAVYERRREIGICSSVGLSPTHISSLFVAEACVYGVLGGIAGYLIGQGVARGLAAWNLLPSLSMNYSSLSTVAITSFIIIIALLSTVYPARVASRVASPRSEEKEELHPTEAGIFEIQLPFVATGQQAEGVNHYLLEFLNAHQDASVGSISTEQIRYGSLEAEHGRGYRLSFVAWLVPFDLGVSQEVHVDTVPGEDADQFHIVARMEHRSGDLNSWERLNRNFIDLLRRQFLIWRSLSPEEMKRYVHQATVTTPEKEGPAA